VNAVDFTKFRRESGVFMVPLTSLQSQKDFNNGSQPAFCFPRIVELRDEGAFDGFAFGVFPEGDGSITNFCHNGITAGWGKRFGR
jgi:hypothetical protein